MAGDADGKYGTRSTKSCSVERALTIFHGRYALNSTLVDINRARAIEPGHVEPAWLSHAIVDGKNNSLIPLKSAIP